MKKRITTLLLATLMLLCAAACANAAIDTQSALTSDAAPDYTGLVEPSSVDMDRLFGLSEMPDIPDIPVATLGEYTVLRSDYAFFFYQIRGNIEYSIHTDPVDEGDLSEFWDSEIDENGTTARAYLRTNALSAAKELAIIHALAVNGGTQVDETSNQQSDFEVLSLLAQHNSNEQEFADYFQMTSQQMREANYRMNLILKFMEESMEQFTVTEEEIRTVFDAARHYYDAVTVRHILIACTDSMTVEEQAVAKLTAEELFQMLQDGSDIGELAYSYSEDSDSRYQYGEYTFARGQMAQELEDWAFSASEGDQDLIKTDDGYYIIELISPGGYASARGKIEHDLRAEMFYQSLDKELELVDSPDWVIDQEVIDSITI